MADPKVQLDIIAKAQGEATAYLKRLKSELNAVKGSVGDASAATDKATESNGKLSAALGQLKEKWSGAVDQGKKIDEVRSRFEMFRGIAMFAAPAVVAIGAAVIDLLTPTDHWAEAMERVKKATKDLTESSAAMREAWGPLARLAQEWGVALQDAVDPTNALAEGNKRLVELKLGILNKDIEIAKAQEALLDQEAKLVDLFGEEILEHKKIQEARDTILDLQKEQAKANKEMLGFQRQIAKVEEERMRRLATWVAEMAAFGFSPTKLADGHVEAPKLTEGPKEKTKRAGSFKRKEPPKDSGVVTGFFDEKTQSFKDNAHPWEVLGDTLGQALDGDRQAKEKSKRQKAALDMQREKIKLLKDEEKRLEGVRKAHVDLVNTQLEWAKSGIGAAQSLADAVGLSIMSASGWNALYEGAEAIAAFARYDYWAGAQHTAAAIAHGVIAGKGGGSGSSGSASPSADAGSRGARRSEGGGFGSTGRLPQGPQDNREITIVQVGDGYAIASSRARRRYRRTGMIPGFGQMRSG